MGETKVAVTGTRQEILREVINSVKELIGNSNYEVEADSHLIDDLGCDSLDIIQLTMELEERFGVQISDATAASFTNCNAITDAIVRLQRA